MKRKVLSVLMIIAVLLCYMPSTVFADEIAQGTSTPASAQQIGNYYEVSDTTGALQNSPTLSEDSTQQSYEDGKVLVNKTIKGTDTENVFDVTLDVTTKDVEIQNEVSEDAAVVLVIDVSESMKNNNRLTNAKKAAQTFINSFADTNGKTAIRKIAIVKFSGLSRSDWPIYNATTGAEIIQAWTDASTLTKADNTQCDAIKKLTAYGGTNLEAGLQLAKNLLSDSSLSRISNKNIVLLTDGKPTYGIDHEKETNYNSATVNICANGDNMIGDGNSGEVADAHNIHTQVETLANSLDVGIGRYAVFVGNDELYCGHIDYTSNEQQARLEANRDRQDGSGGPDEPGRHSRPSGTKCYASGMKGSTWLASKCGFTTYNTNDADDLNNIFANISELIKLQAQAWILTDPMGTNIDLVTEFDSDDANEGITAANNEITWNLRQSTPTITTSTDANGKTTTERKYSLTYRIKLDNLKKGVDAGTLYPTNGVTKLSYLIVDSTSNVTPALKYAYFNVPSVKGFAGSLEFTKTDDAQKALPGATFTLTTADDASWKMEAISDSSGKVKFSNIPSGHTYTLTETNAPAGYLPSNVTKQVKVSYGTLDSQYYTGSEPIVNKVNTTSVSVTKTWNDSDNQDGKRPGSITIKLYKGNEPDPIVTETVSQDNNGDWKYTFENLTKYDENGNEIAYRITEDAVDGYTSEITGNAANGFTVTNTHTPETTSVSGTKTWNDNNNQDGKRPSSITVRLKANGNEKASKTVTANDNWAYSFTNLPKYANGQQITYTVTEDDVTDYSTAYNGYDVTNSYTPEKTSVTVTKVWNDNSNQDGKRPISVQVQLYANGQSKGDPVTLNEGNQWTYTFSALDKKSGGTDIAYTVKESKTIDGYASSMSGDAATGFTITNTHTPETITVSGTKTWDGDDESNRPASVTIKLYAGSEQVRSATVTAGDSWKYSFTGLPKYANGTEIEYKIAEADVLGYNTEVTDYDVKNTYAEETVSVSGQKSWDDSNDAAKKRPSSITVELYANNAKISETSTSAANEWKYSFTNLPRYSKGAEVAYRVQEQAVAEYTASYSGYNITNTYNGETTGSLTITKVISGLQTEPNDYAPTFTITGPNNYSITKSWSDFIGTGNKTLTIDGLAPGNYTVTESNAAVRGYSLSTAYSVESINVSVGNASGITVTNTYTENPTTGSLTITKATSGATTPADATFTLTNEDGTTVKTATYSQFTGGSYTFTDLTPGTYTVTESGAAVDGYTLSTTYGATDSATPISSTIVAGGTTEGTVTNTYTENPTTGSLTITKTTNGATTPADATFTLKNGQGATVATVTYSQFADGSYTFTDLTPGTYTVTESGAAVDGYTLSTTYGATNSATPISSTIVAGEITESTVTNTYTENPTTGSLTITKTTSGTATTPDNTIFNVLDEDGVNKGSITYARLKATGSYTFTGLPFGTYTVTETGAGVTGHKLTTAFTVNGNSTNQVTVDADGETVEITNSYELIPPTEGTLTITKASAGDATTPDGTVFELYLEKELIGSITYGEFKDAGSHTFTGLAPGTYTVKESNADVAGYTLVTTYKVTSSAADEPSVATYNLEEEAADTDATSAQVAVTAGKQSSVEFTNTYTKINDEVPTPPTTRTFRLTLNKQVLGVDNLPADYAVTVTVSNKFGPVKVLTLKANEPQTIYLSRGDYTLSEDAPAIDGYTLKSQEFSADSFYLTYGGQDVTITNTYDKNSEDPEDPEEPKDQDDKNPPAEPKDPSDDNGADDENESDVPKTGDSMSFFLYALTAAGALLGLKKLSKREHE